MTWLRRVAGTIALSLLPRFVARWLVFGKLGQHVPIPAGWVPHIFARAIGCSAYAERNNLT